MSEHYSEEHLAEDAKTLKSLGLFVCGFVVLTVILIVGSNLAFA